MVQNFIFIVIKSLYVGIWRESPKKEEERKTFRSLVSSHEKDGDLVNEFLLENRFDVGGFGLWSCYKIYSITKKTLGLRLSVVNAFFLATWAQKSTMCSLNFLIIYFDPIQMLMFLVQKNILILIYSLCAGVEDKVTKL